ncbi:hypothetical protein ACFQU9_31320 [Actinomadura namibiensis]|uniref:Uncharacterized protein n=1 Tax=Actinomadura namibiensis TaxID=182080 RepID=A0A7W3LIN0_ACTNM|nr:MULTISPECIES: hypothetical protein [Actinomadura]MBA8948877.1 hypothetical protein [Actinomadura namibiensis]
MNNCLLDRASALVAARRRTQRSDLCWQRPQDQERRRRQRASSRYPRVGRT